jgi:TRAP-type C4-dicarboxylate transport system permease small subunit
MTTTIGNFLTRLLSTIHRIEDGIIIMLLSTMLGFAVLQIILRNVFHSGIHWSDSFLRILVLWLGLMGAMIASRNGKHINIDLLSKYLPGKIADLSNIFCQLFTAVVSATVAYYSALFVLMEKASGDMAFANVPLWICEAIIPFAFAVISVRYFVLAAKNALSTYL